MKYAMKILSAAVVSTAFMGPSVGAASCNGSITLTGPDSTNIINCKDVSDIALTCKNNIVVGTINTQTGTSGNGGVIDNTSASNVATGNVVNENGQKITIGSSCGELTNITNDTNGGSGGGTTPGGTPGSGAGSAASAEMPTGGGQGAFSPEILPNTSTPSSTPAMLATTLGALVGAIGIFRILTSVYNRIRS